MSGSKASASAAGIMVAAGALVLLLSLDILPPGRDLFRGPAWVSLCTAALILSAGCAMRARRYSAASLFFTSISVSLLAAVLTWVALGAGLHEIGGGIPFLPARWNQRAGTLVFGVMAAACWLLAAAAWTTFFDRLRMRSNPKERIKKEK